MLRRLVADESGQSMVEYGLIVGVMAVGISAVLITMKVQVMNIFISVGASLGKILQSGK